MGLFDDVVGMVMGGEASKLQAILTWVDQQGGVEVLLGKLREGGIAEIVESWLSNNQANQTVHPQQIQDAIGLPAVADLGEKLGVDSNTASALLAQYLPKVIDALSPQGDVHPDASNDLVSAGMNLLKGKLFS